MHGSTVHSVVLYAVLYFEAKLHCLAMTILLVDAFGSPIKLFRQYRQSENRLLGAHGVLFLGWRVFCGVQTLCPFNWLKFKALQRALNRIYCVTVISLRQWQNFGSELLSGSALHSASIYDTNI